MKDSGKDNDASDTISDICSIIPTYNFMRTLSRIASLDSKVSGEVTMSDVFSFESRLVMAIIINILNFIVNTSILAWIEMKNQRELIASHDQEEQEVAQIEDDDVTAEREKCRTLIGGPESDGVLALNLRKVYKVPGKPAKVAVDDVSLTVSPNEMLCLLGANGAGKTTTLRMLTADESPTRGQIKMANFDLATQLSQIYQVIVYFFPPPLLSHANIELQFEEIIILKYDCFI